MPELNQHAMGRVRRIHFVGIGGAGMSGIAEVLHNLGYEVSGSDISKTRTTDHLKTIGIKVIMGHDASYINGSDVVVTSSAIPISNPELKEARRQRIPVVPRAEMLAELMRFKQGIAVAGTHGKTTTTSLIASLLGEGGLDPTYVIGGLLNSTGSHAELGEGNYLVAEADESDASFLHLQPVIVVVTNIDADHLGTYEGNFQYLKDTFSEFINRLPFYGLAVLCIDDPGVREIIPDITKPYVTYGIDKSADFNARIIKQEQTKTFFIVSSSDKKDWINVQLNMPGNHNVLNALAAIIAAVEVGIPEQTIINALSNFQGIARRCDVLGKIKIENKIVLLIDDYAHHPSEIAAMFSAISTAWPQNRIVTVFQPHRYTRTRDLFKEFCQVLSKSDVLLVFDIYSAGEAAITNIDSCTLCKSIQMQGKEEAMFIENRDEFYTKLPQIVEDEDILLILGAGDIGSLGGDLINRYGEQIH